MTAELRFQFLGRIRALPEPVAVAGEVVIDVESVTPIVRPACASPSRFHFGNPVRKLLFFIWREGIVLTWNKVQSVWLQRRLEEAAALVAVIGHTADGRRCLCIGPQATSTLSKMTFPAGLCALLPPAQPGDGAAKDIAEALSASAAIHAEVAAYSVHSGTPVPSTATELIRRFGAAPTIVRSTSTRSGKVDTTRAARSTARYSLTLLGCGAYPMAYTIPALHRARRYSVVDLNPCIAAEAARKFRFQSADTNSGRAIDMLDPELTNAVVIATYHSTHAELVRRVFSVDPAAKVLVEKPPVTALDDAYDLAEAIDGNEFLEIGYNRRYAGLTRQAALALNGATGPITMTCVVKELRIPASHWYHWPNQGTRVTGNLSHWFDLATYFIRSNPVEIHATQVSCGGSDEVSATIAYDDSSMCVIVASDRGSSLKGVQEWIEIRRSGVTVRIDDFVRLVVADESGERVTRVRIRDKGHARMYREFEHAVLTGGRPQYPVRDLLTSTLLYTTTTDMLRRGHSHRRLPHLAAGADSRVAGASCTA